MTLSLQARQLKIFFTFLAIFFTFTAFSQGKMAGKTLTLTSPDKQLSANVQISNSISYSLNYKGRELIMPSTISMTLNDGRVLGQNSTYKTHKTGSQDRVLKPLYYTQNSIVEKSNDLTVDFNENFSVVFRAFNEGFAYHFVTRLNGEIIVRNEEANFKMVGNPKTYFHNGPMESSFEYEYDQKPLCRGQQGLYSMPFMMELPDRPFITILESDLLDYPGMHLSVGDSTATSANIFGVFPQVPKKWQRGGLNNFNLIVTERLDYIAKTQGARSFPWRIVAVADAEKNLFDNHLLYILASESKLADVSWVKPGKLTWDWWNDWNLTGVPFEATFNTATYKYFIDFAAKNGMEYVGIDDGWSDWFDLFKRKPDLDMEEITAYAKKKNIGLILWCVWHTIDDQMIPALEQFEKWGIVGLKVDFMDRDDQIAVNFYEKLSIEAAKRKILVNYHGAYKPTGFERTYPNQVTREGVRGLEYNKLVAAGSSPEHAVTLPFIRNIGGGMEYTPGAMTNTGKNNWHMSYTQPSSQGTRCNQMAMYTVFYSPLMTLSDSPTAYEKEQECTDFITKVPPVWDETVALNCKIGDYVTLARRKGDTWFLGAMTDWTARNYTVNLDFLGEGTYEAVIFSDGINAGRNAKDYQKQTKTVSKKDVLEVKMASGGGYTVRFTKKS
jgi:alpha-glucosidase